MREWLRQRTISRGTFYGVIVYGLANLVMGFAPDNASPSSGVAIITGILLIVAIVLMVMGRWKPTPGRQHDPEVQTHTDDV